MEGRKSMKEFEKPIMEIIHFEAEDVLTTSGSGSGGEDSNLPDDEF